MNKKIINAVLIKNDNSNIVLRFKIDNEIADLNLESNNSEEIKSVFIKISKLLRVSPLEINYVIDESISSKEDELFIDSANEYIGQLKKELMTIENDNDLKELRKYLNLEIETAKIDNLEKIDSKITDDVV